MKGVQTIQDSLVDVATALAGLRETLQGQDQPLSPEALHGIGVTVGSLEDRVNDAFVDIQRMDGTPLPL